MSHEELRDSIAIVGMAGRFPGANTLEAFWHNLSQGVESISFFTDAELDRAVIDPAELSDPHYVKARAVLDDVEQFDAGLFGFTPKEAELTDPQHRVFLECAWEALEHAGYNPERYPGLIGIFGGAGANTYLLFHLAQTGHLLGSVETLRAFIHNKNDHLTTRAAYKLNLRGPAVTVQTACSTSLVAVSLACQSLLNYQLDMALAGGVTITVPQRTGYLYHERGIGSPDGHCRAFDADAQGTVGGNGAGIVVLKRYEDALADGDTIYALIRAAAINNDGAFRAGYTAPNGDSQTEVIALAQALAGVDPDTITYVEAHGTATPLGDPIEIQALTEAFRRKTDRTNFCALGSVKTNLGHLDTAAGIAGLLKTVLALQHKQIPPSLHFRSPNPAIDFANSPFYVNTTLRDWRSPSGPRRAGVSSFGMGGTNAHVILEEAPPRQPSGPARPWHLLLVSGRTAAALERASSNLADALKRNSALNIADVVYTLQVGRKAFEHRRMLVCRDARDAAATLEVLVPERVFTRAQEPTSRPLTFLFPGQGAQYADMAAGLYRGELLFREWVDRCAAILLPHLGMDIRDVLYGADQDERRRTKDESDSSSFVLRPSSIPDTSLDQTWLAQPALFVVEYALAQLWMAWGMQPQALIGHSIGEYVAACLAGVFSLEDALALVAARGRLIQGLPPGAMLAVPLSEREVGRLLDQPWGPRGERLSLAAVNSLAQCVVSGPIDAVEALEQHLSAQGQICRRLHTSHAFHSTMMEPILDQFAAEVARIRLSPPQIPYLSNVTGTWATAAEATDPAYWVRHLRGTVRFADGLAELLRDPSAVLLEVGPGHTLRTIARWHPHKKPDQFMLASLPGPRGAADEAQDADYASVLSALGQLWLVGIEPDWTALYANQQRQRLPLPSYPFERQRYWIDLPERMQRGAAPIRAGRRNDIADWFYVPGWKQSTPILTAQLGAPAAWLVFLDERGLAEQVATRLEAARQRVVRVRPGPTFQQPAEHDYQIRPHLREDYELLLAGLRDQGQQPDTILHAWSVAPAGADSGWSLLDRGFSSLLMLAQALGSQGATGPLGLFVLMNNAHEVVGGDLLEPERATVLGPCLVIPREYPNITCRAVDVALPRAGSWQEQQLVDQLVGELTAMRPERLVAYRGGRRWEQTFEPLHLAPAGGTPALLRPGGVYLITGGLGGIGMTIAGYLARAVQARLVLVGRSAPPDRTRWADWLATHDPHNPQARQIRQIQELEAEGAQVLIGRADVTDERQMRAVLVQAQERFGPIDGVIHAAGVPGGGLIQRRDSAAIAAVLAPKLQGTRVLARLFANARLDFFILQSSLTTVVGRLGQADYTAANAFLDAFAHDYYARTGTPTTAIDWGAWAQVGMAARPEQRNGARAPEDRLDEETPPAGAVEPLGHPLLERRIVAAPGREVYLTDFNVDRHWVLDEHRILGNPVIPGVAYFEMVRAALGPRARGYAIEFQDVFFVAPLRVPDGETREVRLVLEEEPEGYGFSIRSALGEDGAGPLRDFTIGKVRLREARPLTRYDLHDIRRRCGLEEILLAEEQREEDLGPRWHSVRRVAIGHNEVLLELELPEAFAADFDAMQFHPALLDRAAGIAKNFLAKDGHYLPLTYKRLTIHAPLQRKIYSYARFHEEDSPDRETITFDIVLLSEEGAGLVEIIGFSQKRVNDPAVEIRALATALAARSSAQEADAREPATRHEIQPLEGVDAFARILAAGVAPQVVVSPRDLQAAIEQTDTVVRERILEASAAQAEPDRPQHARPNLNTPYVAPESEIERTIAAVWQQVLGIERVGIHDNFFELGGDSLIAIQVISRLERELQISIPPVAVFEGATIHALALLLGPAAPEKSAYEERQSRGEERRSRLLERRKRK